MNFLRGGCNFYIKNNLKSEMFNDKKMFFSVVTKNSNCETLTKNLSFLKYNTGLRIKKFNVFRQYRGRGIAKMGGEGGGLG